MDVSNMNQPDNIHASLNSNMGDIAADPAGNANNSMCGGCHVSDSSETPANSSHPNAPGKIRNPYKWEGPTREVWENTGDFQHRSN